MLDAFVALDLETTGLSLDNDQIIEVGATRFDRSGAFENFTTFVDPGRSIPREVRDLTGIADADLRGAPRFGDVREAVREFIGDRAIVGQNIAFDLAFLRAEQIVPAGPAFDTWELASVLLPTATRLNLGSLAAAVGVHMPVAHRALADAEATRDIFLALVGRLEALPRALLLELRAFATRADWAFQQLIDDALARGGGAPLDEAAARMLIAALPVAPPRLVFPPLVPRDPPVPPRVEEIDALFARAAARDDLLPAYERRPGQEMMARAVAEHLDHGGALAVEAGTGIGKSLAYLLPTLLHALRNDDRVVISTHTLNLQDQVAHKDLPVAAALVEEHVDAAPGSLRTTVLKGRTNYLCLERWAQVRLDPSPRTEAEARLFGRVAAWLPGTETGDLSELYMTSQERPAWDQVSADGTDCLQRRCAYVRDGSCFLLRARSRAASAHAVVVNHALLLANAARADQLLPPFRHLVLDEAHRLEEVATQHYGSSFSTRDVRDLVDRLGQIDRHGEPGFVRRLQGIGQGEALALSPLAALAPLADRLEIAVTAARESVRPLGDALRAFVDEHAEERGGAPRREVALTAARRAQPAWEEAAEAALHVDLALQVVAERLTQVRDAAAALPEGTSDLAEGMRLEAGQAIEALVAARETLRRAALQPRRDDIAWLAIGDGDQRLHLAPLEVAERLEHDLYRDRGSVLVTSATLAAAGSFDFTLDRLGLAEADTLEVPSPFDYRRAVLTCLVEDMPEPGMPGYERGLHEAIADAARAAGGRTLVLFTSHTAVRAAAGALRDLLGRDDIVVLAQGLDGSPGRLLRLLVERPRTVLLGTAAFWEGIDVQGEALSQILVARLPFPVPNDPVYAGRAEQFGDPFAEYAVPQAIIRFRQGFGRLIRGTTDRGVFVVLDSRIVRRSYGELFVDALPECEVRHLRADGLARAVGDWLA